MARKLSIRQRRLAAGYVEHGNIAQAGREAGYEHRQNAHAAITKHDVRSAIEVELAKQGIDDTALAAAIGRLLHSDNEQSVSRAIEQIIKLKGLEKPRKSLKVNVDYSEYAKTALNDDNTQISTAQRSKEDTLEGREVAALVPSVSLV